MLLISEHGGKPSITVTRSPDICHHESSGIFGQWKNLNLIFSNKLSQITSVKEIHINASIVAEPTFNERRYNSICQRSKR